MSRAASCLARISYFCSMEQLLRRKIEELTGHGMALPRDFAWLAEQIGQRTSGRLSPSTLRRFWGYVDEGVKASTYTKNILAEFVGYRDFAHFVEAQSQVGAQSDIVLDEKISSDDLRIGQIVVLTWLPDRRCVIRHEGDGKFAVVESQNTRLTAGDTFECHLFVRHEPAYLANWRHRDSRPMTYCIGKKDGVNYEL